MQILIRPIITEKSLIGVRDGRYVFEVAKKANQPQIAQEIKKIYKVDVVKVNIINVKGEKKLIRQKYTAKIKGIKKAIVTLKKGQKIPGFEEK
ncbi:MAG: ribosomal protein large subunit ribosomal protein [Candidatus Berkelbacteria bacterium]|nr:ribosomal protein large subunit ribosomal protein [Candidatus Berkelbacteria bacterium]